MSLALCEKRAVFPPILPFLGAFAAAVMVLWLLASPAAAQHRGGSPAAHAGGGGFKGGPRPINVAPVPPAARPAAVKAVRPTARAVHRPGWRGHSGKWAGHRRFKHRAPTPVWIDPNVYGERIVAVVPGEAPAYDGPDEASPPAYWARPRQQRCVAPKIIQVGPIDRQSGPGPRLVYGSKNRCGAAEFVNLYKPRHGAGKKAKRRHIRK